MKNETIKKIIIPVAIAFAVMACVGLGFAVHARAERTAREAEKMELLPKWADNLYEPQTSITQPATIVWPASTEAQIVADETVRPNTMIVAIDENLAVSTLDGQLITDDLAQYLIDVKDTTLAALYIRDRATADAFNAFAQQYAVADVFVVAASENSAFVKEICDANTGILGIIDWTGSAVGTDRSSLYNITKTTNAAHAKIAIVPENITGSFKAVEYLRSMLMTVWAQASADEKSIYTAITNGVNGIVCEDYLSVASALESFNNGTTLVRHVFITGHRGLPSEYIENTIRSERGAIEAGADVLECDIRLSSDGVPFVLHDIDAERLFNNYDIGRIEDMTIAEIQALQFDMTDYGIPDETSDNITWNSVLNANITNRATDGRTDTNLTCDPSVDYIPTLEEYLDALDDPDVIQLIEIKSDKPAIVTAAREICEKLGVTDRVCIITFKDNVLKTVREEWPEVSAGFLGNGAESWTNLDTVTASQGIGAAVGTLYMNYLQPYNSTLHDACTLMYRNVISAARHRGLTSWAWTYNDETWFAKDYLKGGTCSMTTNFSTWATNLPVRISASDQTVSAGGSLLRCTVTAQNDSILTNQEGLSLVKISGVDVAMDENGLITGTEAGEALCMVRLDTTLDINGVDASWMVDPHYAIYSNPFVITVK